jgi:hypothetical protein
MFNRTLLIIRRTAALIATTIAIGLAARTPSTLKFSPPAPPHPMISGRTAGIATVAVREVRAPSPRRLAPIRAVRTRCSARPNAPARTRPTSTRSRQRAARA